MASHGSLGRDLTFFCLEEALLCGCSFPQQRCLRHLHVLFFTCLAQWIRWHAKGLQAGKQDGVALALTALSCMPLWSPGSREETSGALEGATLQ